MPKSQKKFKILKTEARKIRKNKKPEKDKKH